MRQYPILLTALMASGAWAGEAPTYTLGNPLPAEIRCTVDASANPWLASNAVFVATAGFEAFNASSALSDRETTNLDRYSLAAAEAGFSWERLKPEYYLSDVLDAPEDVDWHATYTLYREKQAVGEETGFLFNPNDLEPCVYAISGGNQTFNWVLKSGVTNEITYVIAMSYSGRPRRIYWTDLPYNGPKVSLAGKFVRFMGNDDLLKLRYATVTNYVGGVEQVQEKKIVRGLYVDPDAHVLCAAGELTGQCVMVYYDTGSYENILAVQVVEVRRPEALQLKGTLGEPLRPDGQGYETEGLTAVVSTGIGDSTDNRGDYLYQHKGSYSYSKKNGDVFPLRPTVDARWLASVYWMETDAMGVQWPFEYDQYENDWPADGQCYVRGDVDGDPGARIYIDKAYAATLQPYQDPEGHALAVDGDNTFYTKGAGWSMLKLVANDDVWFVPIRSILRSDRDFFTLAPSRVTVGRELSLRSGSRSGLADGVLMSATAEVPGYIYKPVSGTQYDVDLYHEPAPSSGAATEVSSVTNCPSAIYAVATGPKNIEVWWSERVDLGDDAPAPLTVPVLPQVYRPVWPEPGEMPQIVIASQQGSANEIIYQQNGAAFFDSSVASIALASRRYFPAGEGTVSFWTRPAVYASDVLSVTNAPSELLTLGVRLGEGLSLASCPFALAIEEDERLVLRSEGDVVLSAPMPALRKVNDWTHVAIAFDRTRIRLYLDAVSVAEAEAPALSAALSEYLDNNCLGLDMLGSWVAEATGPGGFIGAAIGREVSELVFRSRFLSAEEVDAARYEILTGGEANVTGYYTFRKGTDLVSEFQFSDMDGRICVERVHGEPCYAVDVAFVEPGAPAKGSGVITAEQMPLLYVQNDPAKPGYNPNEEHAFVRAGSNGYVTWALRCDLGTSDTPAQAAFVEYMDKGKANLRMFEVVLTNSTWRTLGADCLAGTVLPGPHPLDLFEDPWLAEDTWLAARNGTPGVAYRDRKGQLWARAAGRLEMQMYYRNQAGFAYPQLTATEIPAVGTPIPWLALLDHETGQDVSPLTADPAVWTWNVSWPAVVPELRIGQTLTVAENGLPEVWNAKSMSVIYPNPKEAEDVVLLTDPTVIQSVPFEFGDLAKLGLSTDANGGLTMRSGKYYFTDLPPHLSNRLYLDATNNRLCLEGRREASAAGASVLHPNVLSSGEREKVRALARTQADATAYAAWTKAVGDLAVRAVRPNVMSNVNTEIFTSYSPVDHYALAAMGGTNYVTLIENDATNRTMGVSEGDSISMHVLKVLPEYYTGRIVTREDEVNLLSQQLSVLYTEAFLGEADKYVFEWRSARPNPDGSVPNAYDDDAIYAPKYDVKTDPSARGNTRIVVGEQGDTLANMVNTYWVCRYRAASSASPAYRVMGDAWSEWCAPPALAEGWVQRVLNNITPFNQRMTDLYENKVETPITMIKIAGKPYTGDVALNQDNMTSVGLIELYETVLNKAESLSLQLGINDTDANKQLLLAAERLHDLYALLGDEAYSDAKNPTIGVGSNKAFEGDNQPEVDMDSLSSALFCFDNQVPTLLDEELALLRGRTGASAPVTTVAPYYNRLVWNFTKGITAGEVAYAVNYNISGEQKTVLSEEQAADIYPQGHGDAYGHYLSALKGWYRLIRNPSFSWPVAQGEMVVADSTVNVDYYEEAKFSEAAAKLARTAADAMDLTARKSCRDTGGNVGSGYLDEDASRGFGYGEWAVRGGYGALVNWVTANTLLPVDAKRLEAEAFDKLFSDGALTRIDRGTVGELDALCSTAAEVQRRLDELDAGMNPLGLSDSAVPFDITPIGGDDDSATHYEQIRERAGTALSNARKTLERAQEYSNRLRLLKESNDSYTEMIATQEADFEKELIGYYGTPYSDDIGPGATYVQGYAGPDLIHYMWMDLSKFGLTSVDDTIAKTGVKYPAIASRVEVATISSSVNNEAVSTRFAYEKSASGLIVKPASITGTRLSQGSIQEKYAEFLLQYIETKNAISAYDNAVDMMEVAHGYAGWMTGLETVFFVADRALGIYKQVKTTSDAAINMVINTLEYTEAISEQTYTTMAEAAPRITGAGMTVNVDPGAVVLAAAGAPYTAFQLGVASAKMANKQLLVASDTLEKTLDNTVENAKGVMGYYSTLRSLANDYKEAVFAVNTAYNEMQLAIAKLNVAVEAYNAEVAKGQTCLAAREAARKVQVDKIQQARYNDMFFRLQRNSTLAAYSKSFDLAQRYVFAAAQAYDYETALLSSDPAAGDAFKSKIIGARALGAFDDDGEPIVGETGDAGLSGILAQMDANWLVLKPRLGINNPQSYATWFSLRSECFRILPDEEGDAAWAEELTKYWVDDIRANADFRQHCQPFQSQFGLQDAEPGLIIPFSTTIDFAKNLFGQELAGGDSAYDSTWYATRIAAAGLWFDGYNEACKGYDGNPLLSRTPVAYLVPIGLDTMRVPGLEDGRVMQFAVADQVIPAPYAIGSTHLEDAAWYPSMLDADYAGADSLLRVRRHPSFRAYFGEEPSDDALDATRLVGRSVWNTKWLLVIPAGGMNADREKALSVFINGSDVNRDGKLDLKPVRDIRIGFKTYSTSGN